MLQGTICRISTTLRLQLDLVDTTSIFQQLSKLQLCMMQLLQVTTPITAFRPPVGIPLPTLVFAGLRRLKYVDGCRQRDISTALLPSLVFGGLRQCTLRRRTLPKFVDSRRQTLVSPHLISPFKTICSKLDKSASNHVLLHGRTAVDQRRHTGSM
jgi:hypothetical protein